LLIADRGLRNAAWFDSGKSAIGNPQSEIEELSIFVRIEASEPFPDRLTGRMSGSELDDNGSNPFPGATAFEFLAGQVVTSCGAHNPTVAGSTPAPATSSVPVA
jgi:hypothetical protein